MAGHEIARYNLGQMELGSGNMERAVKHWKTAASAGDHKAMHNLRINFEQGNVSRETIESTLTAYNNSCAKMRSEARDAYIIQVELI
jgi:TPR repeat protein